MLGRTLALGCADGLDDFLCCCRITPITITVITSIIVWPTQISGCGLPIVVVLQVDAIDVDFEEVSAG